MDDDVKDRLDQIQKRFDDFKWYVEKVAGLIILMFGVVAGLFGAKAVFDADSAKTELRESKKEIREEVLGLTGKPEIQLLGVNREAIMNQEVKATVMPLDNSTAFRLKFPYILKNKGSSPSGSLFSKLYTSEPLNIGSSNADEPSYQYEAYLTSQQIEPNPLPAGVSVLNYYEVNVNTRPAPGKYPAKLKFFYGKDQVAEAPFQLVIP